MHARFLGLCQRHLHDLFGDALDLDVHLQSGDTVGGTCHLEVHVAQVILITQNVGQDRKAVFFLDQAHGNTGHVRLDRHASIHQREATAADRSHGGGAVRFGNFRYHAHGVGEVFLARQHRDQSPLGQTAMTDFAPLGSADATRLTGGEGRHVVVHQEAVFVLAGQCIDALGITLCAQCRHHQRLGLTTREQCRTVGARQHRVADFDRPHGACIATINARFAGQNLAAHEAGFDVKQHAFDLHGVKRSSLRLERAHHVGVSRATCLGACLLVADLVSRCQFVIGQRADLGDQCFVLGWRLPVPHRLAGIAHQFMNRVDGNIALLMAEHHGAEHELFAQLLGFRLDHQNSRFGSGDHQIEHRILACGLTRVQHIFAIDVADTGGANRAAERDAADRQGGTGGNQGGDVCIHFGIERQRVHNHMHFVEEAFRKQRANRAIDQTTGQRLKLAGTAFTFEKAAGNLASRVGFFKVIHRQRKEILPGFTFGLANHGCQHHGAVHVEQDSAIGLACDFTGFHGHRVLAPLEGLANFFEYAHLFLLVNLGSAGHLARARIRHHRTRCHSREIRPELLWNDTASLRYCLLRSKKRLS